MSGVLDRFRRARPPVDLTPGEKVLAWAGAADGAVLAGTRDAFVLHRPDGSVRRVPWEHVEAADWEAEQSRFRLREVGRWGEERREHTALLADAGLLLGLVRERVSASVVLQRHVAVRGRSGLRVIARRAPHGRDDLFWLYEYDEGIDPADPTVEAAAAQALAEARVEVGLD